MQLLWVFLQKKEAHTDEYAVIPEYHNNGFDQSYKRLLKSYCYRQNVKLYKSKEEQNGSEANKDIYIITNISLNMMAKLNCIFGIFGADREKVLPKKGWRRKREDCSFNVRFKYGNKKEPRICEQKCRFLLD